MIRQKKRREKIKGRSPNPAGENQWTCEKKRKIPKHQIGLRLPVDLVAEMDKTPYTRTQLIEIAVRKMLGDTSIELKIQPGLLFDALCIANPTLQGFLTLEMVERGLFLLNK